MKPISPLVGAIIAHFIVPDEKFNISKVISLILCIFGFVLTSLSSFNHPENQKEGSLTKGYIFLTLGVIISGISMVHMKIKVSKTDPTATAVIQMFFSGFLALVIDIFQKGFNNCLNDYLYSNLKGYIYASSVGVFVSAMSVYGALYLVNELGAVGSSFYKFGQIVVGVLIGIFIKKEWNKYSPNEVLISSGGIILLFIGVLVGFIKPKNEYKKLEVSDIINDKV